TIAVSTPWVMRYLEYYRYTLRPFAIVPGLLYTPFHTWMFITPMLIIGWIEWRLWKAAKYAVRMETLLLIGSMLLANGALVAFTAFGFGRVHWPVPMAMEMVAAAGMLAHFLRHPHGGRRPSPASLMAVFLSTALSCFSGFLLFYNQWMQLLACALLA